MADILRPATIALSLFVFGSCTSTKAPDPAAQTLVESVAASHQDIVRLTVHAVPTGEQDYKAVASTLASKLGQPSDPEDLKAIRTGEVVVLEESGGLDVTVPIRLQNGRHTAAAGVTIKAGIARDAAIAEAKAIASELERGLTNATMKK